jgi:hypothetical protein
MTSPAILATATLRIVEKHYSAFSVARQEALAAEVTKTWS